MNITLNCAISVACKCGEGYMLPIIQPISLIASETSSIYLTPGRKEYEVKEQLWWVCSACNKHVQYGNIESFVKKT